MHKRGQKCTQHSSRGQNNIKIEVVETEYAEFNWIYLAWARNQSWENTMKVMKLRLHKMYSKPLVLYSSNVHVFIED